MIAMEMELNFTRPIVCTMRTSGPTETLGARHSRADHGRMAGDGVAGRESSEPVAPLDGRI
jgi:hypothetical protein